MGRTTVPTMQEREDGSGGRNWGEAGRPLMTPDEIARSTGADTNQQLLLRGGSDPVFCSRYHVYWWKDYQFVRYRGRTRVWWRSLTVRELAGRRNLRSTTSCLARSTSTEPI